MQVSPEYSLSQTLPLLLKPENHIAGNHDGSRNDCACCCNGTNGDQGGTTSVICSALKKGPKLLGLQSQVPFEDLALVIVNNRILRKVNTCLQKWQEDDADKLLPL